jgi:hypothetical protein
MGKIIKNSNHLMARGGEVSIARMRMSVPREEIFSRVLHAKGHCPQGETRQEGNQAE